MRCIADQIKAWTLPDFIIVILSTYSNNITVDNKDLQIYSREILFSIYISRLIIDNTHSTFKMYFILTSWSLQENRLSGKNIACSPTTKTIRTVLSRSYTETCLETSSQALLGDTAKITEDYTNLISIVNFLLLRGDTLA